MNFNDKVVLVTGASSGIGAAIAIRFAEQGAKVAIVGRNKDKLKNVAAKCNKSLIIAADISNDEDCKRIINETVEHFGRIDILVNNAGIFNLIGILDDNALQVYDKVMNTNLRSAVYITHLAVKHLIASKGNIINISAVAALGTKAGRGSSMYSTSKAALDHFARYIALDLATYGVRVNTINPGPVKTDIIENAGMVEANDQSAWESMKSITALNRVSEPVEVANLALYLASDLAVGITGTAVTLDNGVMLADNMLKM